MNCNTGHLVSANVFETMEMRMRQFYDEVPDELRYNAHVALDGNDEVIIDLTGNSKLSNWANKTRNQRKQESRKRRGK